MQQQRPRRKLRLLSRKRSALRSFSTFLAVCSGFSAFGCVRMTSELGGVGAEDSSQGWLVMEGECEELSLNGLPLRSLEGDWRMALPSGAHVIEGVCGGSVRRSDVWVEAGGLTVVRLQEWSAWEVLSR